MLQLKERNQLQALFKANNLEAAIKNEKKSIQPKLNIANTNVNSRVSTATSGFRIK